MKFVDSAGTKFYLRNLASASGGSGNPAVGLNGSGASPALRFQTGATLFGQVLADPAANTMYFDTPVGGVKFRNQAGVTQLWISNYSLWIKGGASGSLILTGGGNTDLEAGYAGNLALAGGFGSSDAGRLFIGNGSGWNFYISKRSSSSTLDLFTFSDKGNFAIGGTQLAATATDGFLYVPSVNGTPTGTPTSYGSSAAMAVDTTSGTSKLWVRVGGSWKSATLS